MSLKEFFIIIRFKNILANVTNAIDIYIGALNEAKSPQLLKFLMIIVYEVGTERQIEDYGVIVGASSVAAILAAQEIFKMVLWEVFTQTLNKKLDISFREGRKEAAIRYILVIISKSNKETRNGRSGLEKESAGPKRTLIRLTSIAFSARNS